MTNRYEQLFDYLSAPELPTEAEGTIVFGRKDPKVAEAYVDLARQGLVSWGVITGGVGKDSGDLTIPESEYLAHEAVRISTSKDIILPPTFLETAATNGAENVRNSLAIIRREKLGNGALTAVAHATSLRRLAAMVGHESVQTNTPVETTYRKPSNYNFDPTNPTDQQEALAEMNRLITWPSKGWLPEGSELELPDDLVDFTTDRLK